MKEILQTSHMDEKIHNLEPVKTRLYYAFVPSDYDEEIKEDIKIVFAKYVGGYKSFDYTKRTFLNSKINNEKEISAYLIYKKLLDKITNNIWDTISDIYNVFDAIELKKENNITFGLCSTFARLTNSYESSLFLLKNKYFFESISINRLIFEQLNYCFNLINIPDEDFQKLSQRELRNKLKPTDINKLKKFLPDAQIGTLYSLLSELTHIDYPQVSKYITYSNETGLLVTMKSITQSIESALLLIKLVDIHSIIFEYSFKDYADIDFKYISISNNCYIPNDKRLIKNNIEKYHNEFIDNLKNVKIETVIRDNRKSKIDDDLPF